MLQGPIIIGGLGGSGTRIVSDILMTLNVYLGNDLNHSLDNTAHTFLFKRPKWFYKNRFNTKKIETGIKIMEKTMINKKHYSLSELTFLINATISMSRYGHNIQKEGSGLRAFHCLFHILFNRQKKMSPYSGWGWKEPNSHLILKNLNKYFPNFKYIHTIRHGLDMAYSNNQQQLFNWGPLFGVPVPKTKEEVPKASFRYWVEVNRSVLELGKTFGQDKFLILNFDNLCINPDMEISKLINFLGIQVNKNQLKKAVNIPIVPDSRDRFKNHDISGFRGGDIEFLHSLGYKSS